MPSDDIILLDGNYGAGMAAYSRNHLMAQGASSYAC